MINIITHIKSLVRQNKLPNALLIIDENNKHGYNLIKSIAFWLLCNEKTNSKICKKCTSCLLFLKGKHPDYHELYSNTEIIKLDTLKQSLAHLSYKPTISKHKVMLLSPINLFSDKASTAILKTLEEPPQNTFFLLISHRQYIFSTIKDRCQVFNIICKSKLKSLKIIRFLYNYLIFNKTDTLSSFINEIEKKNEDLILNSIYIFLLQYLKHTYMKKKTLCYKNIDKMMLLNILNTISQNKYLRANHLNLKSNYFIEDILKLIKDALFFPIKNNQP